MVFFAMSEEISEAEGDDPLDSNQSKKIICRFQIHVSSAIHEALMPYHPAQPCTPAKNTVNQAQSEKYQCQRQNISGQKIEDKSIGITAKNGLS